MKRKMAILFAACMLSANFLITSYGANFSDINNVPWPGAVTYINTVSDLGLMVGDIDAKTGKSMFRAKDHVTYCETTQLAYALLKKTGKLKEVSSDMVSRWTQVMQGYNIPAWAYECVAYALENNIISLTDASRFVSKKNGVVTNNYASRESVAVIFGKFLSHLYTIDTNATLTFHDKASIASTSVPYVDLLARLNIMVGDTDSNFTPKAAINRAETAVLVSKTYDVLNSSTAPNPSTNTSNIISGTVISLEKNGNNQLIAVTTSKGDKQGFIVDNDIKVYEGDTTKTITLSMIEIGDGVSIEYEGAKANVIRLTNDVTPSTTEVKGTIDDATSSRVTLLKSDKSTENYYFAKDFEIKVDNKKVSQKDFIDEFDEYIFEATLTLDASKNITMIDAKKGKETGITGILVSISEDELSVKTSKNSKTQDFEWISNPDIYLEGKESTVSRVRRKIDDDETLYVKYYLDSKDRVKKVMVSEDEFGNEDTKSSVTGTISSIDDDGVTIRKKSDNKRESFDFASKIKYYLDGDSCSFRDVEKAFNKEDEKTDPEDFHIKVYLDDDGDVTELYASLSSKNLEGKEEYDTVDGKVLRMSEDEIRVEEDDKKGKNYDISRKADYYMENSKGEFEESTYSKVRKAYSEAVDDDDDFFVTLYLEDDEVIKIEASPERDSYGREIKGTITKLSETSITLKDKNKYDIEDEDSVKIYLNDSRIKKFATLEDIVGDKDITLKAVLTIQSGNVTEIDAYYYEVKGELISVDGKTMKIETRDETIIDDIEVESRSIDVTGDYTSFRDMTEGLRTDDITVTLECSETKDDKGKVIKITARKD